jgi:hypothetical protein
VKTYTITEQQAKAILLLLHSTTHEHLDVREDTPEWTFLAALETAKEDLSELEEAQFKMWVDLGQPWWEMQKRSTDREIASE